MSSLPELPPLLVAFHHCVLDGHGDSAEDHSYCKDEEVLEIQKGGFGGHDKLINSPHQKSSRQ